MNDEELKYYKVLQPMFKENMGELQDGDKVFLTSINKISYFQQSYITDYPETLQKAIRLPLLIDPVNPERGLWGMIGGIGSLRGTGFEFVCSTFIGVFEGATPALALLKALAHQEGVKI